MTKDNSPEPEYWQIPRKSMTVRQVLDNFGYKFYRDDGSMSDYLSIKTSTSVEVGDIYEGHVRVGYNTEDLKQINAAEVFRSVLEKNYIPYTESPSRKEAISQLRAHVEGLVRLLDPEWEGRVHDVFNCLNEGSSRVQIDKPNTGGTSK